MSHIAPIPDFVQDDSFVVTVQYDPAIDISGYQFEITLKKREKDTTPVMSIVHNTPVDADAANGKATIPIPAASTSLVPPGEYFASVKRINGTNIRTLLRTGKNNLGKVTCYQTLSEKVVE